MSQRKNGTNQLNHLGGRFIVSAVVLTLLLFVYFTTPMAFANEEASSSAYGTTTTADDPAASAPAASAAPAEDPAPSAPASSSESSAASAEYVSAGYDLSLICGTGQWGIYWDSREDYNAGLLSIDYRLENRGTGTAYNVGIVSATADRGVTVDTDPLPFLGDIVGGGWKYFTLKWLVPKGVGSFKTDVQACADCDEEDEGAGDDEPGDEESDDGDDSDDDDSDDDSDDESDDDDSDDDDNGNNGNNSLTDDPAEESPKDEGSNNSTVTTGGTPVNEVTSNNVADSSTEQSGLYRSALPNTGAGLLADTALGIALGLFGLLGLWVSLRVAGAHRK